MKKADEGLKAVIKTLGIIEKGGNKAEGSPKEIKMEEIFEKGQEFSQKIPDDLPDKGTVTDKQGHIWSIVPEEKAALHPRPGTPGKVTEYQNEGMLLWTLGMGLDSSEDKARVTNLFSQALTELNLQQPPEDKQFFFEAGQIFYKHHRVEEVRLSGLIYDESGEWIEWKTPTPPRIIDKSARVSPAQYVQIYSLAKEDEGRKHFSILISRPEKAQDERGFIYQFWDLESKVTGYTLTEQTSLPESDAPSILPDFISIPSGSIYHKLQDVYAGREFSSTPEGSFPRANLKPGSGINAIAELRPSEVEDFDDLEREALIKWQKEMEQKILKMDDETADVLDAMSYIWAQKANNPDSYAVINSYDILQLRGMKPKKCGSGHRGQTTFTSKQFANTAFHIGILRDTWITVINMETIEERINKRGQKYTVKTPYRGESAVILVKDKFGQQKLSGSIDITRNVAWRYQLGTVLAQYFLGPGRETALMSCKALNYDPYREQWEKRIVRYLTWQWRIRQSKGNYLDPYKVQRLLEVAKVTIEKKNPSRTKDRFEKALDRLLQDKMIAAWQYESSWDESTVGQRRWGDLWQEAKVCIEPPVHIINHYQQITMPKEKALPAPKKEWDMGTQIQVKRKKTNLTLMQAAEQIGISSSQLSEAERGVKGHVGKKTFEKIRKWLDENP